MDNRKLVKKHGKWCSYCQKHGKPDYVNCEDCEICENCEHPKAWHYEEMDACMANEDSCGCGGYKPSKRIPLKQALKEADELLQKSKEMLHAK